MKKQNEMKKTTFTKTLALVMALGLSSSLFYCNKKEISEEIKIQKISIISVEGIQLVLTENTPVDITNTGTIIWEGGDKQNLTISQVLGLGISTNLEATSTYYLEGKLIPISTTVLTNEVDAIKFTTAAGQTRIFQFKKKTAIVMPSTKQIQLVEFKFVDQAGQKINMINSITEVNKTGEIIWDSTITKPLVENYSLGTIVTNPPGATATLYFNNVMVTSPYRQYDEIRFTKDDLKSSFILRKN